MLTAAADKCMWSFSWPVANSLASEADRVQVPGLSSVSFTHKYAGVALTRLPTQGRHHPEVLMEDAVFRKARRGGHSSLHFILTVSGPNLHSGRPCLCQLFLERPGEHSSGGTGRIARCPGAVQGRVLMRTTPVVSFENQLIIKMRTARPGYTLRFGLRWEVGICSQTSVLAFYSSLSLKSPVMDDVSLKVVPYQPLPICRPVVGGGFGQRGWLPWFIELWSSLSGDPALGLTHLCGPQLYVPGVGNVNPLQYSCLENSRDRGA